MHPSIQPIHTQLTLHTQLFLNTIADVDDDTAKIRINDRGNHMLFIACHLLDARYYIARQAGISAECPFQDIFDQAQDIEDMETYPVLDELKTDWQHISSQLEHKFHELTADELGKDSGMNLPIDDLSILGEITFLMSHESYHIGQLGLLRRQMGLDAMRYS